jgi:hypothetical protein
MNNYSNNGDIRLSFSATPAGGDFYDNPLLDGAAAQNLGASFARREQGPTRLIAEVAHLYHEERCTQNEIANKLRLSQGTVSRLLKKAEERPPTKRPSGDGEKRFSMTLRPEWTGR